MAEFGISGDQHSKKSVEAKDNGNLGDKEVNLSSKWYKLDGFIHNKLNAKKSVLQPKRFQFVRSLFSFTGGVIKRMFSNPPAVLAVMGLLSIAIGVLVGFWFFTPEAFLVMSIMYAVMFVPLALGGLGVLIEEEWEARSKAAIKQKEKELIGNSEEKLNNYDETVLKMNESEVSDMKSDKLNQWDEKNFKNK